ncbi:DUF488 domain-containing protein [Nostoc sp. HG1]|nr:DUF488 domain-containing protein [Nostoc sp. HG1]
MAIFTSYYAGQIKGEAVSISLYPPKGWKNKHSPIFAPTPELLQWWKSSDQDAKSQEQYKRQFIEILQSRQQMIELWVNRQRKNPQDITLCCYEKVGDFCHRHQVGEEVVQKHLPELWGGEVGLLADAHVNNADTLSITDTSSIPKHAIPIDSTFAPTVQSLLSKCYDALVPVVYLRLPCGYYRVSLHGEDLGNWSELGVLAVLSLLQHEFYRGRLVRSLAAAAVSG